MSETTYMPYPAPDDVWTDAECERIGAYIGAYAGVDEAECALADARKALSLALYRRAEAFRIEELTSYVAECARALRFARASRIIAEASLTAREACYVSDTLA